jgi:hypothetical protein
MTRVTVIAALISDLVLVPTTGSIADESKLKDATGQVESGAKAVGQGIADTAKGVGNTVVEGARTAGEKIHEAGKAAEPQARSAWEYVKDGVRSTGQSMKNFFTRLFGQ